MAQRERFSLDSAKKMLRGMGMEQEGASSIIYLHKKPIGLSGWAAVDYLRRLNIRIVVKSQLQHDAEEAKKQTKVKMSKCVIHSR